MKPLEYSKTSTDYNHWESTLISAFVQRVSRALTPRLGDRSRGRAPLRWSSTSLAVAVVTVMLPFHMVRAGQSEEADVKEEIVLRCHYEMGEFGVEMVRQCVETENSALQALQAYPEQAKAIVSRCTQSTRGSGWAMVKACIDRDIEADAALAQYPVEHAGVIQLCRTEMGKQGPAKVKACVDQRISADRR